MSQSAKTWAEANDYCYDDWGGKLANFDTFREFEDMFFLTRGELNN